MAPQEQPGTSHITRMLSTIKARGISPIWMEMAVEHATAKCRRGSEMAGNPLEAIAVGPPHSDSRFCRRIASKVWYGS